MQYLGVSSLEGNRLTVRPQNLLMFSLFFKKLGGFFFNLISLRICQLISEDLLVRNQLFVGCM